MQTNDETMQLEGRIENATAILEQSIARISHEAKRFNQRASRERWYHTSFSATIAVLGVAAPALVTYQTQVDDPLFSLLAILLTAIVGASAALQATFRWGERFRRTKLAALELDELEAGAKLRKYDWLDNTDRQKVYQKVYELLQYCETELQRILREHGESEVEIVIRKEESQKPSGRAFAE